MKTKLSVSVTLYLWYNTIYGRETNGQTILAEEGMIAVHLDEQKERIQNSAIRALMVFISLMLQILWFFGLGLHLSQYYTILNGIVTVISWILALHVYSRHMNSAYKLSWIVLILVMPVLGISMYALFGSQMSHVWIRRYMHERENVSAVYLQEDETVLQQLLEIDYGIANQCHYIQHQVGYPLYQNTDVEYHNDTQIVMEALKAELQKAESFILMEFHAIEDSIAWADIEAILTEKAASGVEVRLL
ncbi:MAG: PLDc N-terminal domain-containing protein, partial [Peptococcaceae bacterium]|nr:PLDc N-terminal domain-containing protein [Peptococcaceae bacterium]